MDVCDKTFLNERVYVRPTTHTDLNIETSNNGEGGTKHDLLIAMNTRHEKYTHVHPMNPRETVNQSDFLFPVHVYVMLR